MAKTNIGWTDFSWNIARGCSKVDEDCKFCYMFRDSFNNKRYDPATVVKTKTVFRLPLKIKEPSRIFVSSLTDVFHEGCDPFRNEMWEIIEKCPHHIFQVLTKRPERIDKNTPEHIRKMTNVWFGTSVGSQKSIHRLNTLMDTECAIRFVSFEPLHGPVDLSGIDLSGLNWAIIGGESGNNKGKYRFRECRTAWMEDIISKLPSQTSVFVKQMGTHLAKELGMSDRHGTAMSEFPESLRKQNFPVNETLPRD